MGKDNSSTRSTTGRASPSYSGLEFDASGLNMGSTGTDTAFNKQDKIGYEQAVEYLKVLDAPKRAWLCWASLGDGLIEKLLHQPIVGRLLHRRSLLLSNELQLKLIYAVTAFRRGTINTAEKTLHTFILFIFFYAIFRQDQEINFSTLKALWGGQKERGFTNLVHSLDGMNHDLARFLMVFPLVWGVIKVFLVNYDMATPSKSYLRKLQKDLSSYKPNYFWDTLGWLNPRNRYARALRKTDLLLTWNERLYPDARQTEAAQRLLEHEATSAPASGGGGASTPVDVSEVPGSTAIVPAAPSRKAADSEKTVTAETLINSLMLVAKVGYARTQLEAMHALKLIAFGVSVHQTSSALHKRNKAKAFQTLMELRDIYSGAPLWDKLLSLPRRIYARYLLWELGVVGAIQYSWLPLTLFKSFKLYTMVNFYLALKKAIEEAAACPKQPGFEFGLGFADWAKKKTLECFYTRINLFRTIDPKESVEALASTFPEYHLTEMVNLYLPFKGLTTNETVTLLNGFRSAGAVHLGQLALGSNQLADLPANTFQGFGSLTSLDLGSNQLTTLSPGAFQGLGSLTSLDLDSNQLSTLSAGTFQGLNALTSLDLSYNQITTLSSGTFQGLNALMSLNLIGNHLTTLSVGTFQGLNALTSLELNSNHLTTLSAGTFQGLNALTNLDLGSNKLTTLLVGTLQGLDALTSLELDSNKLSTLSVGAFQGLDVLTSLYLGGNQFTTLSSGTFQGLNALTSLDLHSNQLSTLAPNIFSTLTHLQTLDLENNDLNALNVTHAIGHTLTQLVSLDLGFNQLEEIPAVLSRTHLPSLTNLTLGENPVIPKVLDAGFMQALPQSLISLSLRGGVSNITNGCFKSMHRLVSLDLNYNSLITLSAGTFQGLEALTSLGLAGNQLTTLPADAFQGLDALTSLDLNSNYLYALSARTFQGLDALTYLDLSYNQLTTLSVNTFRGLNALTSLDLDDNQLTTLSAGTFQRLNALTGLDLSDNHLDTLSAGTFQGLNALTSLDLGSNKLTTLSTVTFQGLNTLASLYLYDNQLTTLSAGTFQGLDALTGLYLSNNQLNNTAAVALLHLPHSPDLQTIDLESNQFTVEAVQQLAPLTFCMNISADSGTAYGIDFNDNLVNQSALIAYQRGVQKHLLDKTCEAFRCNAVENAAESQTCFWNDQTSAATSLKPGGPYAWIVRSLYSIDVITVVQWLMLMAVAALVIYTLTQLIQSIAASQQKKKPQNDSRTCCNAVNASSCSVQGDREANSQMNRCSFWDSTKYRQAVDASCVVSVVEHVDDDCSQPHGAPRDLISMR